MPFSVKSHDNSSYFILNMYTMTGVVSINLIILPYMNGNHHSSSLQKRSKKISPFWATACVLLNCYFSFLGTVQDDFLSLFFSLTPLCTLGPFFLLLLNRKTFSVYLIASPAVFQFLFDLDPTRPTRLLCWIGDLLTTIDQNRQTWMRLCRQHRTQLSFLLLLY